MPTLSAIEDGCDRKEITLVVHPAIRNAIKSYEIAWAACHDEKLNGTDIVPEFAGRSPSYIFRQLYEYQHGFRAGPESKSMVEVVNGLKEAGLLALPAYLGTLER